MRLHSVLGGPAASEGLPIHKVPEAVVFAPAALDVTFAVRLLVTLVARHHRATRVHFLVGPVGALDHSSPTARANEQKPVANRNAK